MTELNFTTLQEFENYIERIEGNNTANMLAVGAALYRVKEDGFFKTKKAWVDWAKKSFDYGQRYIYDLVAIHERFGELQTSANLSVSQLKELVNKVFDDFDPEELLAKAEPMTIKEIKAWIKTLKGEPEAKESKEKEEADSTESTGRCVKDELKAAYNKVKKEYGKKIADDVIKEIKEEESEQPSKNKSFYDSVKQAFSDNSQHEAFTTGEYNKFMADIEFTHCDSQEEVKKVYRKYSKFAHPDKGGSNEEMGNLNNLYDKHKNRDFSDRIYDDGGWL